MKIDCPCKDCADRTAECHPVCEKYKAYSEETERIRNENYKKSNVTSMLIQFRKDGAEKACRGRRR